MLIVHIVAMILIKVRFLQKEFILLIKALTNKAKETKIKIKKYCFHQFVQCKVNAF